MNPLVLIFFIIPVIMIINAIFWRDKHPTKYNGGDGDSWVSEDRG